MQFKKIANRLSLCATLTLTGLAFSSSAAVTKETNAPYNQEKRICFYTDAVNSFNPIDEQHLMVRVNASKRYLLTLSYPCHNLKQTHEIKFGSRGGLACNYTRSRISTGKDKCTISDIRKVDSFAEAQTLAKLDRDKLRSNRKKK